MLTEVADIFHEHVFHCTSVIFVYGDRGSTVVKVLRYKPEVAGSIPDGVIGIFC